MFNATRDRSYTASAERSRANDDHATEQLARRLADVPWEARNQVSAYGF